ncbi:aminotransferase class III-fold pyridoxal phosphate-dependent enzyme [Aporhodopirellula aestuarii]|uniref:Aminotransferase class III-fold pyridoxal phosphate-dependent enzyme n=1 Tax=Aporhodopirellula aestuarii TaxID=2950107 RepID=A0ABT0U3V7_9BACT|nr:aminotransferase class III-fold pyridoxal phosphate-dependent enzyme [Aporhodopirellula aestuarii]MCM2371553.1 aminotransferase class III-fold pyridoxal phosphate-dependent enzyme [Aporhodopirellula aestuarii]
MHTDYNFENLCMAAALPEVAVVPQTERIGTVVSEPMHEDAPATCHPYAEFVNPYLAELLNALNLDKCFVSGHGCRLSDARGREYLDCIAAYGALPLGSNPEPIWRALLNVHSTGEPSLVQPSCLDAAGQLAARLIELAPGDLKYVTFANSGAEAVEAAIKMCRAATGRSGIVATHNSFHGKTLGALAATGNPDYQDRFAAPTEQITHVPFGDIDALRIVLEERADQIAAVLVEPIQGEGGIVEPQPEYLLAVRKLCDENKVLLIFDEIQTGLGRTGTMFACEADGVAPDVMTLAKALGGGLMPIGAVLSNERAFSKHFALKHSSTFAGNTLAARAGLAMLDVLTQDDGLLIDNVHRNGRLLKLRLEELRAKYPRLIAEVRGRGYLLGIKLGADRHTWRGSLLGVAAEQSLLSPLFASYLLNVEGVRVAPTLNGKAVIRIEPPLSMKWCECEELLAAFQRTLEVFDKGNIGQIISAILNEMEVSAPQLAETEMQADPLACEPQIGERRFAFLVHPLELMSAGDFDPTLAWLPKPELEDIAQRLTDLVDPFVLSHARIQSEAGESIYGEFIVIPRTAEQLADMPREDAMAIVREGVEIGRDRGAQIVGLGAFTSVVTRGGKALSGTVPLTTGNSYTAVACAEGIAMALNQLGDRLSAKHCAAIVGATGAIGRSMAVLLAENVGRLVLLGNPDSVPEHVRTRLHHVATTVCEQLVTSAAEGCAFEPLSLGSRVLHAAQNSEKLDADFYNTLIEQLELEGYIVLTQDLGVLPDADILVTATSATNSLLGPRDLKHGAIVCDLSRPFNVSRDVAELRPDVLVIDGGVIRVPGLPELGRFGIGTGHAFSCMAETMLLTLAGHFEDTSLGTDLDPETLRELRRLAAEHGFRVGGLRRFGVPLDQNDWNRLLAARGIRMAA